MSRRSMGKWGRRGFFFLIFPGDEGKGQELFHEITAVKKSGSIKLIKETGSVSDGVSGRSLSKVALVRQRLERGLAAHGLRFSGLSVVLQYVGGKKAVSDRNLWQTLPFPGSGSRS